MNIKYVVFPKIDKRDNMPACYFLVDYVLMDVKVTF